MVLELEATRFQRTASDPPRVRDHAEQILMSDEDEVTIQAIAARKFGRVDVQEDGSVFASVILETGEEIGFMMPASAADEMTGALIERSPAARAVLGDVSSPDDADFHVTSVEELPHEGEKFVVRLASEGGPSLTFRLGSRQVRRWRDALTAQIARHQFQQRH